MSYICDENGENCQYYPDEPSGYDFGADPTNPYGIYSNWGGDTLPAMGVADDTNPVPPKSFWDTLKGIGTSALNAAATPKGLAALVPAILAMLDRPGAIGGGTGQGYQGPKQYARNVTQGKYGPIVKTYAAEGGLMQAYANGGHVRPFPMQDGGFVMTGDAVKGIGGIENLQQILPEAQPITGPGTATSDSIPATIRGRNGITPAKVSNGEAYVPPGRDTEGLYALMRELERKA